MEWVIVMMMMRWLRLMIDFILFCFVLFCFVLFCFILFCFVLFCFCCVCFGYFKDLSLDG